jgi:hypothetical protein
VTAYPVNDEPAALGDAFTADEDTALAIDLGALVDDVETAVGDLTCTIVGGPATARSWRCGAGAHLYGQPRL